MSDIIRNKDNEICTSDQATPQGVMAFSGARPVVRGGFAPSVCQQSLQRVGQIRFGKRTEKGLPTHSEYARFISPNKALVEHAAQRYGGVVQPCTSERIKGQWEVITEAKELKVYMAPVPVEQWFKQHDGGGRCTKKCDTVTEHRSGKPCSCPLNDPDAYRKGKKQFCKPTTTIELMLIDLPGIGTWKLETGSMVAASQLPLSVAPLQHLAMRGVWVPATLSSPIHKGFTPDGEPTTYPVVKVDVDVTMIQLYNIMQSTDALVGAPEAALALAQKDGEVVVDGYVDDEDIIDADASEDPPTDDGSKISAYIRGVGLQDESIIQRLEAIGESPIIWVNQAVARQVSGPAFLERLKGAEDAFNSQREGRE